jgi:hypothetical protein
MTDSDIRSGSFFSQWVIGDITLQQILTPVEINGKGQCRIHYSLYNGGTESHVAGFFLNQDIIINRNDGNLLQQEEHIRCWNVDSANVCPLFWQALR